MSTRPFSIAVAALVAVALVLSACGSGNSPSKVPSNAVAVVDETPIMRDEFDALWESTVKGYKAQGRTVPKPGAPEFSILRNQLLEILVQRIVTEEKAKEDLGITVTDAEVDSQLREFKKRVFGGSEKRYRQRIAAQGQSDEQVRASIKSQVLSTRISEALAERNKEFAPWTRNARREFRAKIRYAQGFSAPPSA